MGQGQSGQKVHETPPSHEWPGSVVSAWHPSYVGSTNRGILVQAGTDKK
jgi:hypothetical protein